MFIHIVQELIGPTMQPPQRPIGNDFSRITVCLVGSPKYGSHEKNSNEL